eukprot:1110796-Amorphochlora_amoeboformis.AAC.2
MSFKAALEFENEVFYMFTLAFLGSRPPGPMSLSPSPASKRQAKRTPNYSLLDQNAPSRGDISTRMGNLSVDDMHIPGIGSKFVGSFMDHQREVRDS